MFNIYMYHSLPYDMFANMAFRKYTMNQQNFHHLEEPDERLLPPLQLELLEERLPPPDDEPPEPPPDER